jgi:hypothetical protein
MRAVFTLALMLSASSAFADVTPPTTQSGVDPQGLRFSAWVRAKRPPRIEPVWCEGFHCRVEGRTPPPFFDLPPWQTDLDERLAAELELHAEPWLSQASLSQRSLMLTW